MNPNPTAAGTVFATAAGFCGVGWTTAEAVSRFQLPTRDEGAARRGLDRRTGGAAVMAPPPGIRAVIAAVCAYFDGARVDFTAAPLDPGSCEPFHARVYDHVRLIPWGRTTTYGAIARTLDTGPEAAREVGQAMARNPLPLLVPCHRVLAAGGRPGGFSAPGGTVAKLRMLALEGIDLAPAQGAFAF